MSSCAARSIIILWVIYTCTPPPSDFLELINNKQNHKINKWSQNLLYNYCSRLEPELFNDFGEFRTAFNNKRKDIVDYDNGYYIISSERAKNRLISFLKEHELNKEAEKYISDLLMAFKVVPAKNLLDKEALLLLDALGLRNGNISDAYLFKLINELQNLKEK